MTTHPWRRALPYDVELIDKELRLFNREYHFIATYDLTRRPSLTRSA